MSTHTDPFTSPFAGFESFFDALANPRHGSGGAPLDVYRRGEDVWVHVDLPGVAADSIDLDVERNVLTVTAERKWMPVDGDQVYRSERKQGTFRRQLHLGQGLDTESIEADYHDGVLTLRVPVAEKAKPRKITVNTSTVPAVSDRTPETASVEEAASAE